MTIVLTPGAMLKSATQYTVTVGRAFRRWMAAASRRRTPSPFACAVPSLVGGSPASKQHVAHYLTPTSGFALVYDAPVDLALLASRAHIAMDASCAGGARTIKLMARAQRPLDKKDPWDFHDYRSPGDSLRRVVSLVPASPLPLACGGAIVAPLELADRSHALSHWRFDTYGAFGVVNATCVESGAFCPTGSLVVRFSTPVRGAEVMRHVKIAPAVAFTVKDTTRGVRSLRARSDGSSHTSRTRSIADSSLRDIFGQHLTGNPAAGYRTTGYEPSIDYAYGRITVERGGFGTLAIAHVNVDTLVVIAAPIPDSLEGAFIRRSEWNLGDLWTKVRAGARETRIPITVGADKPAVTGIKLPVSSTGKPTLWAVQVTAADSRYHHRSQSDDRRRAGHRSRRAREDRRGIGGGLGDWRERRKGARRRDGDALRLHGTGRRDRDDQRARDRDTHRISRQARGGARHGGCGRIRRG